MADMHYACYYLVLLCAEYTVTKRVLERYNTISCIIVMILCDSLYLARCVGKHLSKVTVQCCMLNTIQQINNDLIVSLVPGGLEPFLEECVCFPRTLTKMKKYIRDR